MLWEFLKKYLLAHPTQLLHCGQDHVSYCELIREAECRAKDMSPYAKYAICCASDLNAVRALLACFAAKATAIPLPVGSREIQAMQSLVQEGIANIFTDTDGVLRIKVRKKGIDSKCHKADIALLLYTSGSTGRQKGVMLSEAAIMAQLSSIGTYYRLGESDRVLLSRGVFHCGTIIAELLYSLICGVELYFFTGGFSPERLLEIMQANRITAYTATPTILYYLAGVQKKRPRTLCLRFCTSVGEIMTDTVLREVQDVFPETILINGYGLTESCGRALYHIYGKEDRADCVGKPAPGMQACVVDKTGGAIPDGTVGELLLRGKTLMTGYEADKEKTAVALKDGWLHTGDLASVDNKGNFHIRGRKDEMIIRAGVNIYPSEIEDTLRKHDAVNEVVVHGERAGCVTELVVAQVEAKEELNSKKDRRKILEELLRLCGENLPQNRIPDKIEFVDHIPRSASGKVLRGKHI